MNIKRCHIATHTKQQTENKQERQMDKQMGKDGKLTRATELGYICWWRWAPWAEHRGVTPEHSQVLSSDGCRDVVLGTSCRSCSSTPALRGSVHTIMFDNERLPEPWTLHQVCVA